MGMIQQATQATEMTEAPVEDAVPEAQQPLPAAPPKGQERRRGVAQGNPSAEDGSTEQATPQEQAEYERAFQALGRVMYSDDNTSKSVLDQLQPDDKIGSAARASMLLIKMLDEKLDMDENIVAQMTEDTVEQVLDMAERVKDMVYSEQEAQQVLGATWEGVIEIFDTPPEDVKAFADAASPEEKARSEEMVRGALGDEQAPVNG